MDNDERFTKFRTFMIMYGCTWADVASYIGVSKGGAHHAMAKPKTKKEYIEKLLAAGFPEEILPQPKKLPLPKPVR